MEMLKKLLEIKIKKIKTFLKLRIHFHERRTDLKPT